MEDNRENEPDYNTSVRRHTRHRRRKRKLSKEQIIKLAIEVTVLLVFIAVFKVNVERQIEKKRIRLMIEARLEEQTQQKQEQNSFTLEERKEFVHQHILAHGYTEAAACGMMGNIAVESPDFDPEATGSNGSYGLFQWMDAGDRKQQLKEWCDENGYLHDSLEGQLEFAFYEMEGGDPIACRLNEYMYVTEDAYTAAVEFAAGFERCVADGFVEGNVYYGSIYEEYYGRSYQALGRRINNAMNFYEHYSKVQIL